MSWTLPAFEAMARIVNTRAGLTLETRSDSAEQGMRRAMTRAKVRDPGRYLELIARDVNALDDLLGELTVGETYFFREPAHFQVIRRDVLPDIRRRRGHEHVIRAWSAACASGEEAYSLAILFTQEGQGEQVRLLATDVSRQALAKARQGVYGNWSLRGESGRDALAYMTASKGEYRLHESIRGRVAFETLNLALDVYPSFATGAWGMDLILCRNVLIYLDADTVRNVARRLYQTLAPGGWLITASSDPPLWDHAPYDVSATAEGVFYRRESGCAVNSYRGNSTPAIDNATPIQEPNCLPEVLEPVQEEIGDAFEAAPYVATQDPGQEDASSAPTDDLTEARRVLAQGNHAHALQLIRDLVQDAGTAALEVRVLANLNLEDAEKACAEAMARYPLEAELSYLHAVVLMGLRRDEEAVQALRSVLYLDNTLAIAHFLLGSMLRRRGDLAGARRAYRNARDLCAKRPEDEILPLADGEPAGRLAAAADAEMSLLESQAGER